MNRFNIKNLEQIYTLILIVSCGVFSLSSSARQTSAACTVLFGIKYTLTIKLLPNCYIWDWHGVVAKR